MVGLPVQVPVFVTAVMAVRRMAAAPWPGLDAGGALWFQVGFYGLGFRVSGFRAPLNNKHMSMLRCLIVHLYLERYWILQLFSILCRAEGFLHPSTIGHTSLDRP